MNKLKIIVLLLLVTFFGIMCNYVPGTTTYSMTLDNPSFKNVSKINSMSCESIMSTSIVSETEKIKGSVSDTIIFLAIIIEDDDTLQFIEKPSFEEKNKESAKFRILKNDERTLVAVFHSEDSLGESYIDTFSLNKENGLAIWTKNEPHNTEHKKPVADVFYLTCG